jgi:hypothetical protein
LIKVEEAQPDPDADKDPEYIRRRDWLLGRMKKQHWDLGEEKQPSAKRGRKPKLIPKPLVDQTKPRNKFFKFD